MPANVTTNTIRIDPEIITVTQPWYGYTTYTGYTGYATSNWITGGTTSASGAYWGRPITATAVPSDSPPAEDKDLEPTEELEEFLAGIKIRDDGE